MQAWLAAMRALRPPAQPALRAAVGDPRSQHAPAGGGVQARLTDACHAARGEELLVVQHRPDHVAARHVARAEEAHHAADLPRARPMKRPYEAAL